MPSGLSTGQQGGESCASNNKSNLKRVCEKVILFTSAVSKNSLDEFFFSVISFSSEHNMMLIL